MSNETAVNSATREALHEAAGCLLVSEKQTRDQIIYDLTFSNAHSKGIDSNREQKVMKAAVVTVRSDIIWARVNEEGTKVHLRSNTVIAQ